MQNDRTKSLLYFHFLVFLFGFTSILGVLIQLEALPLVVWRMGIAALALGIYCLLFKRDNFKLPKKLTTKIIFSGILIGVHWIAFFHAIKVAGVSLTLSMLATCAFFVAIIEPLYFKKKWLFYELFFGTLAAAGILIIFWAEIESLNGIVVALIAAVLSALFSVVNSKMVHQVSTITLTFYELLIGFIALLFYLILVHPESLEKAIPSTTDIFWLLLLSIICTSYAMNATFIVMRKLTPFTIMMIINLEPVYGILLDLAIFGEAAFLSIYFYIGFFVVMLAIIANGIFKMRKQSS
ncbi:MAG: DMT family transporter [Flavobacteriaceae bacterium]|nr:DMT family transporter [Flavobacteriaceae bacterium]|tara:strand:+ start:7184 stop:8068 length:885 start_codon:yes stop_codon:yes gene_type:complete